jgi:hypothetical protein
MPAGATNCRPISPDSHADLAELEASAGDRYWNDSGTGMLHLKLVTRAGRTSTNLLVEPQ